MTYYKIISDGSFVGAACSDDLRRYQLKHNVLLISNEDMAQYIQFNEKLYRDNWFAPVITDNIVYVTAKITVIEKEEYDTLIEAIEMGKEVDVYEEEQQVIEEQEQPIDVESEITLDYLKKVKIDEMSMICNKTITDGFDVVLSDGKIYHFSMTIQDQINLISLSSLLAAGEVVIPYHADGELCREYSADDISTVITEATNFKTYHVTYFNSLKAYITSIDNMEKVEAITYGVDIPIDYQSDVLKAIYAKLGA